MKIKSYSSVVIFLIIFQIKCFAQISSKDFEIIKLARGVYAAIHKPEGRAISNAGIVDLGNVTLVFDTFISPYAAEELKRVIAEMGLGPVKYVVNSHYHDDHIRGNQIFKGASIYSTQITRDLIEKTEPEEIANDNKNLLNVIVKSDSILATVPINDTMQKIQLEFWNSYYKTILESHKILQTILPDKIVTMEETIKGSKQSVKLIDMGMGHTVSDLILYIPKSKIIFTGDLLFINNHPWIADGNIDSLKKCLNKIKVMKPSILVPGHGPIGNKNDIDVLLNYLDHINHMAEVQIKRGLEPEQVKESPIPVAYQSWLLGRFYLPNIKFQMKQLLEQKNKIGR
jgi:glyoxylase-like metal-dependent hydrolase (beta-lactamase superfamily II)